MEDNITTILERARQKAGGEVDRICAHLDAETTDRYLAYVQLRSAGVSIKDANRIVEEYTGKIV